MWKCRKAEKNTQRRQVELCFEGAIASAVGARAEQQDAARYCVGEDWAFAVLCDGMGGLRHGGAASNWCAEWMAGGLDDLLRAEEAGIPALLQSRAWAASVQVASLAGEDGNLLGCGTTLVCLYCRENHFYYVGAGDSRLYLIREQGILQLTEDHNLLSRLMRQVAAGELTGEAAVGHPQANALTSYIGMSGQLEIDCNTVPCQLERQDMLLLCSDGVYHTLMEEEFCTLCGSSDSMQSAADEIIRRIEGKKLPDQDNATCILLKYHHRQEGLL